MSNTKAALELGIEINALQEYLEDDLLLEHYENNNEYDNAIQFAKWAIELHTNNGLLTLGLDRAVLKYLLETARDFVYDLEHDDELNDYITTAELLYNYYRQAWAWNNPPVARFNVRKKSELIAQQVLNKAGL
jgi:hypothetical protein